MSIWFFLLSNDNVIVLLSNDYVKRKKEKVWKDFTLSRFFKYIHWVVRYFSNFRVIDLAGDNFEENKRRFNNCVTRLKKDELFLEKIYIVYLSSNFLYPPFSRHFQSPLYLQRFFLPSPGNTRAGCFYQIVGAYAKGFCFISAFPLPIYIYIFSLSSHFLPQILFKLTDFLLLPFNGLDSNFNSSSLRLYRLD